MSTLGPRLRSLLDGRSRWTALEHHSEVTSTNELAAARAAGGAPAGLVVVADHQTAGRGRGGRRWQDHPGGSLLVSCLTDALPGPPGLVPVAAGLAVADALRAQGLAPGLKWPNDVLLDGQKCAGVLVEHRGGATGPGLVIGVGVNVDWRGREPVPAGWTSLAHRSGRDHDRWELLADLLAALDHRLGQALTDPDGLLGAYRLDCVSLGRAVEVETPAARVAGTAVDVDGGGALVVQTSERGDRVRVTAGDVIHAGLRPPPAGRAQ